MVRKTNKYQSLVSQRVGSRNVKNWALEIKFAKTILKLFPNERFWTEFNFPQVYSLGVLLYPENKEKIFKQYQAFNFVGQEKPQSIQKEKVQEDIQAFQESRPKTLRDFLKN